MPTDSTSPEKKDTGIDWIAVILHGHGGPGWLTFTRNLLLIVGVALIFRWLVVEPYRIPSGSMEPTLHGDPRWWVGDRVFVNKFVYGHRYPFFNKRIWKGKEPERFDVVVFKSAEDNAEFPILVKRLIGLPGERILIRGGRIHVNGEPVEMPPDLVDNYYTTYGNYGVTDNDEFSLVPEGHYLVLGDNSPHSRDGRVFGWLPNENLVGRVASIWWPIPRWHDFTGFSKTYWWRIFSACIVTYLIWRIFFGRSWPVHGAVLGDKLAPRAHLYINRIVFGWHFPLSRLRIIPGRTARRGEMVAYYADWEKDLVVLAGRIIALPGEAILVSDGHLKMNGAHISGSPVDALDYGETSTDGFFILSEDPEDLPDSRRVGRVRKSDLIGPAPFVWWPPSKWGSVPPRG